MSLFDSYGWEKLDNPPCLCDYDLFPKLKENMRVCITMTYWSLMLLRPVRRCMSVVAGNENRCRRSVIEHKGYYFEV